MSFPTQLHMKQMSHMPTRNMLQHPAVCTLFPVRNTQLAQTNPTTSPSGAPGTRGLSGSSSSGEKMDWAPLKQRFVFQVCLDVLIPEDSAAQTAKQMCVDFPGIDALGDALVSSGNHLRCVMQPPCSPTHVEIYTDGSYLFNVAREKPLAGWAFVVVMFFPEHPPLVHGYAGGQVAPHDHPDALLGIHPQHGSRAPDSSSAEAEAVFRALLWLVQSDFFHLNVPCEIASDALATINSAAAVCQCNARPFLQQVVRPLYEAASQVGQLHSRWQQSHCGHVYNDMVDTMAKQAARDSDPFFLPAVIHSESIAPLQWLWCYWAQQNGVIPGHHNAEQIAFPAVEPAGAADFDCWPRATPSPHNGAKATFRITAATFNVNTLKQWTRGKVKKWTSRLQILKEQAQHHSILFLQETRSKSATIGLDDGWFVVRSAASSGQGGCAIWLNTRTVVATIKDVAISDRDIRFDPQACKVVRSDARCLALRSEHATVYVAVGVSTCAPFLL